jgi:mRNA interferase HigB
MKVVNTTLVQKFGVHHADVRLQLSAWVSEAEEAEWKTPNDIKARYPQASFLADNRVVFNLKGGNYRLDTKISYKTQVVLVKRIGTHAEYSKWRF